MFDCTIDCYKSLALCVSFYIVLNLKCILKMYSKNHWEELNKVMKLNYTSKQNRTDHHARTGHIRTLPNEAFLLGYYKKSEILEALTCEKCLNLLDMFK